MNEIAKNIKKQRLLSGMSVEEFASLADVDILTARGWENGGILPDIEALTKAAQIFGTKPETLIYGKKTKSASKYGADKSVLITVLTVTGSLLTAAGAVILFITLYQKLEEVKDILSFLPLISGFACAFFAKVKKNGSAVWNEGSAAVWTAGAVITLALVFDSGGFYLSMDFFLLLTVLTVLPVMLIMKAVVPCLAEIYAVTHLAFYIQSLSGAAESLITGVIHTLVLLAGFVYLNRFYPRDDIKTKFLKAAALVTAGVSAFVHICVFVHNIDGDVSLEYFVFILLGAVSAAAVSSGFSTRGLTGSAEALLALCVLAVSFLIADGNGVDGNPAIFVCLFAFSALCVAGGAVYSYFSERFNLLNLFETLFIPAFAFIAVLCAGRENIDEKFTAPAVVLSLVLGALIIASGVRSGSLARTNTGMLTVCAVALFLIVFSEAPPLFKGLSVMAAGAVILVINSRLARSLRKEETKGGKKDA